MIRVAVLDDIKYINDLGKEYYPNFTNIYNLLDYINNPNYIVLVSIFESINGFLIAYKNIDYIELLFIIVDNNNRRSGIGTSLLNRLIEITNKDILLEVDNQNIEAINLYKKLNFQVINIRKKYYSNGNDAFIMKLVKNEE